MGSQLLFQKLAETFAFSGVMTKKIDRPSVIFSALRFPGGDLDDVIRRLQAFEAAGADVLYAPGLVRAEDIRTVCKSVTRPVNVLMGLGGMQGAPLSVSDLAALGARRISVGSAMARAALGAFYRAGLEMREQGTFGFAAQAIPMKDAIELVTSGRRAAP